MSMDIHTPAGSKVKFTNRNGYEIERASVNTILKPDVVYTVHSIDIGGWISYVTLAEFPNKSFNTVMFENYRSELAMYLELWKPWLMAKGGEFMISILNELINADAESMDDYTSYAYQMKMKYKNSNTINGQLNLGYWWSLADHLAMINKYFKAGVTPDEAYKGL